MHFVRLNLRSRVFWHVKLTAQVDFALTPHCALISSQASGDAQLSSRGSRAACDTDSSNDGSTDSIAYEGESSSTPELFLLTQIKALTYLLHVTDPQVVCVSSEMAKTSSDCINIPMVTCIPVDTSLTSTIPDNLMAIATVVTTTEEAHPMHRKTTLSRYPHDPEAILCPGQVVLANWLGYVRHCGS